MTLRRSRDEGVGERREALDPRGEQLGGVGELRTFPAYFGRCAVCGCGGGEKKPFVGAHLGAAAGRHGHLLAVGLDLPSVNNGSTDTPMSVGRLVVVMASSGTQAAARRPRSVDTLATDEATTVEPCPTAGTPSTRNHRIWRGWLAMSGRRAEICKHCSGVVGVVGVISSAGAVQWRLAFGVVIAVAGWPRGRNPGGGR